MEEKINPEVSKQKLPKSLTTVTTFSKILAMALFIALPFLGFYLGMKYQEGLLVKTDLNNSTTTTKSSSRACTMEAKLCSDGSYVSRTGPNCEFSPCPNATLSPTQDETANWKTYTNSDMKFSIKYPSDWVVDETNKPRQYEIKSRDFKMDPDSYPYQTSGVDISIGLDILNGKALRNYINNIAWTKSVTLFDTTLAGNQAISGSKTDDPSDVKRYCIWTTRDNTVIEIQLMFPYNSTNSEELKQIFDNAISTFKLL
jgi:hypothetical protein